MQLLEKFQACPFALDGLDGEFKEDIAVKLNRCGSRRTQWRKGINREMAVPRPPLQF